MNLYMLSLDGLTLNLALDPSCVLNGLKDAFSFDSCLFRSERERERGRQGERERSHITKHQIGLVWLPDNLFKLLFHSSP